MISKIKLPVVVLSYGRAASVLIAHNIGKSVGSLPQYITNSAELKAEFKVAHCHLMTDATLRAQRVFAIRNPVDAILSFALAEAQGFHKFKEQEHAPKPMEVNLEKINNLAKRCIEWYTFYHTQLLDNDIVIDYNLLTAHPMSSHQRYLVTYKDKENLIINYNSAVKQLETFEPTLTFLMSDFYKHKNKFDVYEWILSETINSNASRQFFTTGYAVGL